MVCRSHQPTLRCDLLAFPPTHHALSISGSKFRIKVRKLEETQRVLAARIVAAGPCKAEGFQHVVLTENPLLWLSLQSHSCSSEFEHTEDKK